MSSDALVGYEPLFGRPAVPVEVRCEQGIAGLARLRDDWTALAQMLPDARFYHQYAWHLSYLRNLEQDVSVVHFFSCYREGRPVAIFPLRRTMRTVAGIPLQVWELPFNPHMNLCDVLVARHEDSAALLCQLVRALGQRPDQPWDAIHLPNLLDDSLALRALQAAPLSFVRLVRTGKSMYFPCHSIESAMCHATGHFKRNLRRQRRKLDRYGRIEALMVREHAALDAALADFLRVEASGWKGGRRSAILLHSDLAGFYRDLTRLFGADERCSINLLKLDGKVIAAQYCLVVGKRLNLLKIAYDEAYRAGAPGSQLLHDVIERCCASASIAEASMVTGPAWAAGRWNPQAQDVWDAHVFNASPCGLAAYAMTRLKAFAAATLGLPLRLGEALQAEESDTDMDIEPPEPSSQSI